MSDFTKTIAPTVDEYHEQIEAHWHKNRISRRTALKGALAGVGAVALGNFAFLKRSFAVGGGTSGTTGAVIVGRHVSFASDGGNDPTNSIRISAQVVFPNGVQAASITPVLRYGTTASYGGSATPNIINLTGVVPNTPHGTLAGNQFYIKGLITGLQPGTTYHYQFELGDGTITGDGTFKTAPDRRGLGCSPTSGVDVPAPFTFTSFGDHGTNAAPTDPAFAYASSTPYTWAPAAFDDNYYNVADPVLGYDTTPAVTMTALVAAQNPAFHLMNGDVSYADPSGSGLPVDDTNALSATGTGTHGGAPAGKNAYNPYTWDVYLAQIEGSNSSTPWMIATGNHDMEALYGTHGYGGHQARFDLPQNGPSGCPSVYSFVYGNVGIISVDANDLSYEISTNLNYSGGAQSTWLNSTLAGWRQDPTIDFIVMFMHHCAFSTSGNHASDKGVRDIVGTAADLYQVDLVLSGHNHQVERTDPIRNSTGAISAPDGSSIDATIGTTYLTVGSGGRPRYNWYNNGTPDGTGTTDRYRGRTTGAGATTSYSNSRIYTAPGTGAAAPFGATVGAESINWSQTRYLDYALAKINVVPAAAGQQTTMQVTIVADGDRVSSKGGVEIDSVTLKRTAGGSLCVPTNIPEVSNAILLPVAAGLVIAGAAAYTHHHSSKDSDSLDGAGV